MSLYSYKKEYYTNKKRAVNYASYLTITVGSLFLFWSFYPVIAFEIYSRIFIKKNVSSPVPRSNTTSSLEQASSILGSYNSFSNNLRDFTQADLWFPTKPQTGLIKKLRVDEYSLSIPKLNIKDAKAVVGGEDLSKSLIHYLPETLPGEYGNVNIFGHSTLPQLYNTKDYKTLFTYLPSLEKGDRILVTIGETEYEYEVYDMFIVKPDEVSVLEQKTDAPYLTLITCTPPGTYWERLIVKAKLSKLPSGF